MRFYMKPLLLLIACILSFSIGSLAQATETFDIATFQPPKGWKKQASRDSVQYTIADESTGAFCVLTLLKSLPASGNSKENFNTSWQSLVKDGVKVAAAPQMFPSNNPEDWALEGGFAAFEKDGMKGTAVLFTISGYAQMVNVLILTNTQVYEPSITAFVESITLKKPTAGIAPVKSTNQPLPASLPASASGYGFTTTNFDDGWTSTIREDWVEVNKASTRVLIHYPNKAADAYNSVVLDGLKKAWDVLVSPRYNAARNFYFRPITGWQSIEFAEADMTEASTGRSVYVVLFKMNYSNGNGRYLEFVTPNKAAFEWEFGAYRESTSGWEKMESMINYNKFGVKAADLTGKWTNDFAGSLSYVNAYTGAAAGTDTHASIENFAFGPGNTYKWDLGVASGAVGNIKFQAVKATGKVSVPSAWQSTFSSIEGKPRTYNAHFSAIKGARILWLDGKPFGKLQ